MYLCTAANLIQNCVQTRNESDVFQWEKPGQNRWITQSNLTIIISVILMDKLNYYQNIIDIPARFDFL